ncbi:MULTISPECIES: phage tail sheath C-terminal domain-containing protein [unclassified Sphingopyxis]|uniref:phage tail sheath C-terminal domain-containing protein n=1 Tax=unclassified Sphingopyxis TaxID=2614943 RepID=UPI0007315CAA|nr:MULTISPECIES: phage tail sheath C-terminal domain-containing protein [unclassified Sphingopyxis]KTE24462.1 phage tail protein [Sphingopyxis sp. H057]KTE50990.1 phage tail protein [Sphingopyxis sp. H071]KTE52133.1 phage tail protein [Sphingopyxis sp. H073]KTE60534.1 phage tail protein [Sphingopyxis sp. H107]KTE63877.1 phage tail protein [Sphingopyxis sp. H100]
MISFNQIPVSLRVPGAYVEFDSSRAGGGLPALPNRVLVIGQKLAAGTAPSLVPQRIFGTAQAEQLFGKASILARAIGAFKAADQSSECWAIALTDLAGGTAATGTITVTGPATAAGTIALMIAGQKVPVGVANAAAAATVATAIAAAINAKTTLPVSAAAVGAVVTLTCLHKGTAGNDIDVRHSYYQGEALPAGIGLAIVPMANGAGDPDYDALADAIADGDYRTFILAHHSAPVLTSVETELRDRMGPTRMLESFCWTAKRGDLASLVAFGPTRNSEFVSIIGTGVSPTPTWEWAGNYGAVGGYYSAIDPARPLQTLRLDQVLPPAENVRFGRADREALLAVGIATYAVGGDGSVTIERTVTSYQKDAYGQPSTAFLDAETTLTLSYIRVAVRSRFLSKFPRHKLADDGTRFGAGQSIVTPSTLRAEYVALFRELEEAGLVENIDQFKADLIVERDAADRNRVNALLPPDLVNQLRIHASQVQFRS